MQMTILEFFKKLLSLFDNSPSEKAQNSKVQSIKDECFKTAKSFNHDLTEDRLADKQ